MTTRYRRLRAELVRVQEEFERTFQRTHGLYLDWVYTPKCLPAPIEDWHRFIEQDSPSGWVRWDVFPDRFIAARFHGDRSALEPYLRLARAGFGLLREFQRLDDLGEATPPGFRVRLSKTWEGHYAWLMLLHHMAFERRSAFLNFEIGIHGEPGASDDDLIRAEVENDFAWGECGSTVLRRLTSHRLEPDLFRASAEAIRLWFRPEDWVSVGYDTIDPVTGMPSPAVHEPGRWKARVILPEDVERSEELPRVQAVESSPAPPRPRWDGRKLFVGDVLVKEYTVPAPTQRQILDAFESAGWPETIPDPLSRPNSFPNPKRLGDAVADLNKSIGRKRIRFKRDGTGEAICWEVTDG